MEISVLGMDPSLRNWGLAEASLNLKTGILTTPFLSLVQPQDLKRQAGAPRIPRICIFPNSWHRP